MAKTTKQKTPPQAEAAPTWDQLEELRNAQNMHASAVKAARLRRRFPLLVDAVVAEAVATKKGAQ